MMGGIYLHHITMLVSEEQDDAIRFLFKENKWKCWMKALSEETVTDLMENGFANILADSGDELDEAQTHHGQDSGLIKIDPQNDSNKGYDNDDYNDHDDEINDDDDGDDDDGGGDDDDGHGDDGPGSNDETEVEERTNMNYINDDTFKNASEETDVFLNNKSETKQTKKTRANNKNKSKKSVNKLKTKLESTVEQKDTKSVNNKDEGKVNATNKGKVKCTFCGLSVVNQYILKRHCQRRHKDVWFEFECKDCPSHFKTKEELFQHRNEVNHKRPENNPKREQKRHHTPEELADMGHVKCNACDRYYPNNRLLRRHLYAVHRDLLPKWNCPVCGVDYETREELWKHKRETKHNTSIWTLGHYQCETCGKEFNRYDSFRLHKTVSCGKKATELEELRVHPCDICGLSFKSPHHMKAHKRGVHLDAPEVCDICGMVCKNKRALNSHQKRHDQKNKKHQCGDCGKAFFNTAILKQHIRTHTKEKPYKCPMCPYTCAVKQNIHKHSLKIHKFQAQAIDLREAKEGEKEKPETVNSYSVFHISEQQQNLNTSFDKNEHHMGYHNDNMPLQDNDKMIMKIEPVINHINNMTIPPTSTTSYMELMNYNLPPTDYNPQVNQVPAVDPSQYQY